MQAQEWGLYKVEERPDRFRAPIKKQRNYKKDHKIQGSESHWDYGQQV
jgi:hypothetical protein